MRRLRVFLSVVVASLAVASSAAAHIIVVSPSGTTQWVGGGPVPGQGQGLIASPIGMLPAAHARGLVHACLVVDGTVVTFIPPPFNVPDTNCMHGEPSG